MISGCIRIGRENSLLNFPARCVFGLTLAAVMQL